MIALNDLLKRRATARSAHDSIERYFLLTRFLLSMMTSENGLNQKQDGSH